MPSLLPAPPADPLHILPAPILGLLLAAAGLLVLALAGLVFKRFYRHRPRPVAPAPVPRPAPAAAPPPSPIGERIAAIERRFLASKAFRDGCHVLAAAVKAHLGQSTGLAVERMTSPEIARAIADPRVGSFVTGLSRRRYGREEPRRKHFVAACAEARELLA